MKTSRLRIPSLASPSDPFVCRTCRLSFRPSTRFSSTHTFKNPPPPPSSGYAFLPSRRLISVSGPDSTRFLQGITTANFVPSIPHNTGFFAAFLNAQGRVLYDVFFYPILGKEGDWLIEVDSKEAEKLAKHIKRYKLGSKVDARLLEPGRLGVWSLWGGGRYRESAGDIGCEDKRAEGMGRRILLPEGKKLEVDVEECGEDVYRVRRYLKGVAEGQDEIIKESALPQESNIDYMGGIDYKKGCYIGQELTIRTHHTGVVRKRILPIMLYGKEESAPTELVYDPTKDYAGNVPRETGIGRFEKRGRSAGKFLGGVGNVGLGLCRLETMTSVKLEGELAGFKEDDEFTLEWEGEGGEQELLKVKAFVPGWHPIRRL